MLSEFPLFPTDSLKPMGREYMFMKEVWNRVAIF